MKHLFTFILAVFCINIGIAQVTDSFTTQQSDYNFTNDGIYDIITGDGNMFTEQIGAPQLPVFTQKYLLPEGSILTDISFATTKNQLTDTYYIYPSQPPCALNGEDCPDFVEPDPTIYNATTPFPANTVEVVNDNHTFGYHVISLKICPFEYIPANRILSIYTQINITINYTIGDIEYTTTISEYRHNLARDFVKSIVDNPNAISNITKTAYFVLPPPAVTDKLVFHYKPYDYVLYGGNIPDYIIITNEVLKPQFETFATYKTKKGIPTLVVTVEQIYQNYSGCDNAEKIRNYLKEAHLYWGDALFVLLGGDTVIIPERIGTEENIYNNGTYTYYYRTTDMYYCDVYKFGEPNYNWNSDGDTDFGWDTPIELGPDNFIGRAPVDTTSEAQNFIDKIISYENLTNVTDTDYVNNLLFLGAYGKYPPESHVDLGQQWHDLIYYQSFFDDVPYVNKWRVFDDYLSSIPNTYVGDEELNKVTTIDRLNNGHPINNKHFHLVSHIDHGGAYSIGVSGLMKNNHLNRTDMDNLSNGSYYQIMYTGSCEPGEFEKDCIAEHYVNAPNGGGVAMLANSGFGWFGSQYQPVNLFESLYSNNITNGHIMGVASEKTKYFTTNQNKIKNLVLFGEPTMGVWTATPQNITLTVPTSITIDNNIDNELTVNINVLDEEATVALYKYNNTTNEIEIYAEQTISVGDTTATFIIHPDTEGDVFVKVTAKNYLPVTDAVNIIMPQAHLYVTDTSYDDANSNGYIEQGESITLDIQLTNSGNTNISGISATLSAFNPSLVNITQNQVAYSSIFAGNSAQLTGFSFDVLVTEETPPFIEFIVDIIGSGGFSHSDTFYLDLLNAKLELSNRITTDSDGELINDFVINENVFLDVFLKNTGAINQTGISATLTSSLVGDGIIEITTSDSNYPEIDVNEKFKNETSYVFKLLQTHTGAMPFTLTVQNSFGKTWLYDFDLREALPPLIEGFDFTSSKDEITIMWDPVSNIKGYNIYRSDTENGIYNQINDFLVVGSSLYDDLNLDELTEYYYKIAAVTLSGNELPKSQLITTPDYDDIPHNGYLAWTSLNTHNGFPAGADEVSSVNTCVTVEDINNDGTKELFPALRKGGVGVIMGYKESGEELFDIDGNATTNTGFARISRQDIGEDTSLWTKVAVGDIDNDGQAEVFATTDGVSPSVGYLYGYSTIDEDEDGKPDLLWTEPKSLGYRSFGPPVLANIDNDENHTLEIVTCTAGNSVKVFDTDGTVLWYKDLGSTFGPGTVLVADLDGNGTKEIIYGTQNNPGSVMGLYIWDFEGNDFGNTNPIYSSNDMRFSASPIAGDIDNDGELEIIIVGRKLNIHKLYAFNPDGSFVTGKWDGQIDLDLPSLNNNMCCEIANTPQPAIGDLDDDGFLEVVYADETKVTVYDNNGDLTLTIPIDQLKAGYHMSPILADIDDDPAIEIIIKASNDRIYAFNPDGTECIGWRLRSGTTSGFVGSPSIADLDNDGLNELIISDAECVTHVWKTTGTPTK